MTRKDLQTLHELYNKIARDIEGGEYAEHWSLRRHMKVSRDEALTEAREMIEFLKEELEI